MYTLNYRKDVTLIFLFDYNQSPTCITSPSKHSFIRPFIYLCLTNHLFIHLFIPPFIHYSVILYPPAIIHSSIYLFLHLSIIQLSSILHPLSIHPFIHSSIYSFLHSFIIQSSFILQPFIFSFIHPFIYL